MDEKDRQINSTRVFMGAIGALKVAMDEDGQEEAPDTILSVINHEKGAEDGVLTAAALRMTEISIKQFCSMLALLLPDASETNDEASKLLEYVSASLDNDVIFTCKTADAPETVSAILAEVSKPEYKSVKAAELMQKYEDKRRQWDEFILRAEYPDLYPFLMAELKKKQYRGILREYDLEKLPATNSKYNSLWQQAKGQANAAKRRTEGTQTPKQKAEAAGAITTSIGNLTFPSNEELRTMLSIAQFERLPGLSGESPENTFDNLGRLYPMSDAVDKLEKINTLRLGILAYFLSIISETQNEPGDSTFKFYAASAARDIKLDPRHQLPLQSANKEEKFYAPQTQNKPESKSYDELVKDAIMELTADAESLVGILPNGYMYRALSFQKYDAESKVFTYSSPLLFKLNDMTHPQNSRAARAVNRLIHSSAANDPPAALELTQAIFSGLLERGTNKEKGQKQIEYRVKYSTLIFRSCPQLAHDLAEIDRRGRLTPDDEEYIQYPLQFKNTILKRVFNKASEIIFKKSDAFSYWVNLKFSPADKKTGYILAPTQSTLDRNLVITHEGKPKKVNQ